MFLTQTNVTCILLRVVFDGERRRRVGLGVSLILLLAFLWLLQMVGTFFQMRHYREVLGGITRAGGRGYVGVGNAKARFGKGVLLILVAGEDDIVRKVLRMRGMTVFARFQEAPDLLGLSLEELRDEEREGPYEKATMQATRRAIEQIDRIKAEREVEARVG